MNLNHHAPGKRMTTDRLSYAQDPARDTSPALSYIPSGSGQNVIHRAGPFVIHASRDI